MGKKVLNLRYHLFTNRIDAENYNRNKDNEYLEQLQSKYPTLNDIIKLL